MTIEEWRDKWVAVGIDEQDKPWRFGDLFLAGREFVDTATLGADESAKAIAKLIPKIESCGLQLTYLRQLGQVSAMFPPEARDLDVSHKHHREIWASGVSAPGHWLQKVKEEGWSVRDLRVKLAEAKGGGERKESVGRLKPSFILVQWADAGAAGLRALFPEPPNEKVRATAKVEIAALMAELRRLGFV